MKKIDEIRETLIRILKKHRAKKIVVFGSYALCNRGDRPVAPTKGRALRLRSGSGRGMFREQVIRVRGPEGAERQRGGPPFDKLRDRRLWETPAG